MLKHIFAFAELAIAISMGIDITGCPKSAEAQYGFGGGGFEAMGPQPYGYAQNPLAIDSAIDFATSGADYARAEKLAGALAFRKRQAMAAAIDAKEMERNNTLLRRYMCERFCGPLSPLTYDSGICLPDASQYGIPAIPYAPIPRVPRRSINPYLGRREAFREGEAIGVAEGEAAVGYTDTGCIPGAYGTCGVGAGVYRVAPRAPRVPISAAYARQYEAAAAGVRPYALPFRRRVAESIRY